MDDWDWFWDREELYRPAVFDLRGSRRVREGAALPEVPQCIQQDEHEEAW